MSAIEIRRLRWYIGGRTVLDIDQLVIQPGERVALIGPNGAGKSSLLRVLSGQVPAQGEVTVLSRRLDAAMTASERRDFRAAVGLIHQGLHLVPRLTARENVLIGALARGVPAWRSWTRIFPPNLHREADDALAACGLADRAEVRADRLSGGERQKVAIARLALQKPKLVLADEPTAALDPAGSALACDLLRAATGSGTSVAIVHQAELIGRLADRVIALRGGKVLWDEPAVGVRPPELCAVYA